MSKPHDETLIYGGTPILAAPPPLDDTTRQLILAGLTGLSGVALVDHIREDQAQRWRKGQRVPIEEYLRLPPVAQADVGMRTDLIYCEFMLRQSLGEPVAFAEFVRRFPELEAELRRLYAADQALGFDAKDDSLGTSTPARPVETGPRFLGKYQILERIAEGGQGVVYRALHPTLGKEVVLKWSKIPPLEEQERDRLLAEGQILVRFDHPHIARVFDLDFVEGRPFLVMEFVPGRNLQQYAEAESPTPRQAADLVASIARALHSVHQHGVIHQDIKPKNILIDPTGQPKLIDFGLARRAQYDAADAAEGSLSGTLAFISPEQARGEQAAIGPRSDVFGLGAVLYYLLTGRAPYHKLSFQEAYSEAVKGNWDRKALERRGIPRSLRAICLRAMANDPKDRYGSAAQLAEALEAYVNFPRLVRRIAMAAGALCLAALLLLWTWPAPEALPATKMDLRFWRNGAGPHELQDVLLTGDEVRFEIPIPAGRHASLFLFAEGKWTLLKKRPPSRAPGTFRFPEEGPAPVEGEPGPELVLVCGRRGGEIDVETLTSWLGQVTLPASFPRQMVFSFDEQRVVQTATRAFGQPRNPATDPAERLRRDLDDLRSRLTGKCDFFGGVCYLHEEP